ncbi:MAG: formate dehydrogenase accessory sulfurtransferase FdhD [Nitrososphaerota archaeon]|nr:formate dehydrogenase accessory sulfurtransferase FdhD [Nitrososphaerota archaeon]
MKYYDGMVDIDYYAIDTSNYTSNYEVGKVVVEAPIDIFANNKHIVTLFSTPLMIKELAIGHLLSEGIIKSLDELLDVTVRDTRVHVTTKFDLSLRLRASRTVKVIDTPCATVEDFYRLLDRIEKPIVKSDYKVHVKDLMDMIRELNRHSTIFNRCGAVHSAALFYMNELVAFAEDVGRHNAIDKVIGKSASNGVDFLKCVLVSTGRQSASMVLKAARVGIPIIISIRGAIHSGVLAAQKTGVTYITFNRRKLRVYSYPERLKFESSNLPKK